MEASRKSQVMLRAFGSINFRLYYINTVIFGASICIAGSIFFMQQISTFRDLVRLNIRTEAA